jgi:hypothetical protein
MAIQTSLKITTLCPSAAYFPTDYMHTYAENAELSEQGVHLVTLFIIPMTLYNITRHPLVGPVRVQSRKLVKNLQLKMCVVNDSIPCTNSCLQRRLEDLESVIPISTKPTQKYSASAKENHSY